MRKKKKVFGGILLAIAMLATLLLALPSGGASAGLDCGYGYCERQGCTPGYWKTHLDSWSCTPYSPSQTVGSVFTVPSCVSELGTATLEAGLEFGGGSDVIEGGQILLRAAIAGLLNASCSGVNYPSDATSLINSVNTALASCDRQTMIDLGLLIDTDNNLGCPLN